MKNRKFVNPVFPHFVHGADYNPEQWIKTKNIWDDDIRLMKEAGCNEMTLGIFSWSVIEPSEGVFDFSFLDEIIERIYSSGGRVVLSTPSGARPRWLSEKYPEVLRVSRWGQRYHFGERHNHCFTSPAYREKVKIINTKLAERYSHHPAIIAWHVSNEYGGECYCPLCMEAFRNYLRNKFENDIEKLNDAYWTTFWSHRYSDFSQIEPPSELSDMGIHGLNLDWRRFVTEQTIDFMREEIAPLKKANPSIPVTTNMMYDFDGLDYFKFRDYIDFAAWDCYPKWHSGDNAETAENAAFWHDFYRSLKMKPFFMMESTPSQVNWHEYNKLKRPGMDTLSSLQAIAHGSDSVQYFQWRKSRGSSEKFHGAVVGHDGTNDTRVFRSVRKTGEILSLIDEITGSMVESEAAIIMDWENRWALNDSQGFARYDKKYTETLYSFHKFFWSHGINCDIVHPEDDLSKYKLVVAPMMYLINQVSADNLKKYVREGGILISTYQLGMVDENDLCYLGRTPGCGLDELFGIWREETDTLYPDQKGRVKFGGQEYSVIDIAEVIHSSHADVLAEFSADYYSSFPALTSNKYGKGKAFYIAFRDNGDFINDLMTVIISDAKIKKNIPSDGSLPYGITAHTRTDGENIYLFVANYGEKNTVILPLGKPYYDIIGGKTISDVLLKPFDFSILKTER